MTFFFGLLFYWSARNQSGRAFLILFVVSWRCRITSNYFYSFYREYLKSKRLKPITPREDAVRIQSLLWQVVLEHYMDNEGGVYLDNLGYLCHMIRPRRRFYYNRKFGLINHEHTNGYSYRHFCIVIRKSVKRYFNLKLQVSITKRCRYRMNKGLRYRFLYREVNAKLYKKKGWVLKNIYKPEFLKNRSLK